MKNKICISFLAILLFAAPVLADSNITKPHMSDLTCPNAHLLGSALFNDVCWSCMFPIRLSGVNMFGGGSAPDDAATNPLCVCNADLEHGRLPTVGFTLGFWQPTRLIELTRRPMCFPGLGGVALPSVSILSKQAGGTISPRGHTGMADLGLYNFHYYAFPLLTMLEILDVPTCAVGGFTDIDVLLMGEAFPNWYDSSLAAIVNPEVALFATPVAQAGEIADCASVTAGNVVDKMFWAAGCWGPMYPTSGYITANSSPVRGSSLLAARALMMLSRLDLIKRTVGNDTLCKNKQMPIVKKSQYRLQMMFPVGEAESGSPAPNTPPDGDTTAAGLQVPEVDPSSLMGGKCCHDIGKSTFQWGEWRTRPATGEDFIYLLWQWTDCCMGAILE